MSGLFVFLPHGSATTPSVADIATAKVPKSPRLPNHHGKNSVICENFRNFALRINIAMRTHSVIALLLFAFICMMAGTGTPSTQKQKKRKHVQPADTIMAGDSAFVADSLGGLAVDTTKMDSLQLAIYHHNKAVDDSMRLDSINRSRSGGINSPYNIPPPTLSSTMPVAARPISTAKPR